MARPRKPIIVTRWERERAPDNYDSTHFGTLQVTTREPRRGEGWTVCVVDVTTRPLRYISREAW